MTSTDTSAGARRTGNNTSPAPRTRIVILGGGFGGLYTARHLERLCAGRADVEIVLVNRDNFFLMTPLLFEACSGTLELRHCSVPTRAFLRGVRFVEAVVHDIDLDGRTVHVTTGDGETQPLPYDQLVLALGSRTNMALIPGSQFALTFKTLADAVVLRNHLIECFERADAEGDRRRRRRLLTTVIIGGGLVGVELFGELTAFADEIVRLYPRVPHAEIRFVLLEYADHILPEVTAKLAEYAARVLRGRPGAEVRTGTPVRSIERGQVHTAAETIEAETIVLAAGIVPSPVVAGLPVEKDRRGHIVVAATMRCPSRPEIWALGDCASVPDPEGKPYPYLAQHALRQAKVLARNLHGALSGQPPEPFVYHTLGLMGSLGHHRAFARVFKVQLRGFLAWWVRRTYYLLQMPQWRRRLRIVIDWTFALFFRPDVVKIDLASEAALLLRESAAGASAPGTLPPDAGAAAPARPVGGGR